MTRKVAMNQLFNLIQDEYEIKSASDIEAALLDMFGGFIEQALEAELDQQIVAENVLNRQFTADKPNQKWLTDVTEFKTAIGQKLYLSAILDLYDRSIFAYEIGESNNNELAFNNFDKAIAANPGISPLVHSDRRFQYTSKKLKEKLNQIQAVQSMSRVGRCLDNGPMEGFFGIIKAEMFYLRKFSCREELRKAIHKYISFYNTKRRQKKLKGLAPITYRSQSLAA